MNEVHKQLNKLKLTLHVPVYQFANWVDMGADEKILSIYLSKQLSQNNHDNIFRSLQRHLEILFYTNINVPITREFKETT